MKHEYKYNNSMIGKGVLQVDYIVANYMTIRLFGVCSSNNVAVNSESFNNISAHENHFVS